MGPSPCDSSTPPSTRARSSRWLVAGETRSARATFRLPTAPRGAIRPPIRSAAAVRVGNELETEGVVSGYAIGGAMAMLFWAEPTVTFDLDVFVLVPGNA